MVASFINPVKLMVLLTFAVALLFLGNSRKKLHRLLLVVLALGAANELLSLLFRKWEIPIRLSTNIYIILNALMWFFILHEVVSQKKIVLLILSLFMGFALFNFFLLDGVDSFNAYTFVLGSLLYVVLFIVASFSELGKENLKFFLSPAYMLIFAPVLFFIGYSLIFGFRNREIDGVPILGGLEFFEFISYFVNIIFYAMLNAYIWREKKRMV